MQNKTVPALLVLAIVGAIIVLVAILLRDEGDGGADTPEAALPAATPGAAPPLPAFGPHPASPPGEGPQPLLASRVMLCVPMTLPGTPPRVVLAREGATPRYEPGTCSRIPAIEGSIAVTLSGGDEGEARFEQAATAGDIERVVWVPARGLLFGDPTVLTGRFLLSTQQEDDEFGRMAIIVGLDPDGAELLATIAAANAGQPMTIFIDGKQLRTSDGELWTTTLSAGFAGPITFEGLEPDVALALSDQLNSLFDDE